MNIEVLEDSLSPLDYITPCLNRIHQRFYDEALERGLSPQAAFLDAASQMTGTIDEFLGTDL